MKDMQAQLAKIRADAAECLLLGTIGPSEKKKMFLGMADHLNGLAREIEKSLLHSSNEPVPRQPDAVARGAVVADIDDAGHSLATEPRSPSRSRRTLLSLMAVIALLAAGSLFWSDRPIADDVSSLLAWQPRDAVLKTTAYLSAAETKASDDQLTVLNQRVAKIESALELLKLEHMETVGASGKRAAADPSSLFADGKPSASESRPSLNEPNSGSPTASMAAARPVEAAPAAGANSLARIDRGGPTVAGAAAEADRHRLAIRPTNCARFRSFDPISGTYMTLDGRRRPCS